MKNLNSKKIITASLLIGLVALVACEKKGEKAPEVKPAEVIPVSTQSVAFADFKRENVFYAHVNPTESATLISFGGGEVKKIMVKAGNSVKKGQQLCDIESEKFALNLKTSEAALKIASDDQARNIEHLQNGSGASVMADQSGLTVLQSQQRVIDAKKLLQGANCISPMSGIVGAVIAEKNQNLAPNSPTLSIINDASLKLTFGIPEGEIQGFAEGSKVVVYNAEGDSTASKISSINRILDEKNRTFGAEIQLNNSGRKIKVGEIVRIKALPQSIKNVAIIPTGALMPVAQTTVVMIAQNGKAVRKVVQILASNETMTAISGDVKSGDALIVQGQNRVQDQTLVKIIPPSVEAKK